MRRFGVEVEFEGDIEAAIQSLQAAGLRVWDNRRTHLGSAADKWTVKRDGSVSMGGEMVSPPLDFDDPAQREQVTTAINALRESGAVPCVAAGIHVHVEAKNEDGTPFTAKQIAAVVRFFYKFEDAIYRIASSGWKTLRAGARTFAKPVPEQTARAIMNVRDMDELNAVWDGNSRVVSRHMDRYHGVNLQSIRRHGTIEFRVFNSSLNPKRVQAYIALCIAIMDDARKGYSRSVKKSYRLGAMRRGEVTEQALMLRLQQVLRYESGMSEEDWKNLRKICWRGSEPQNNIFTTTGQNW